MSWRIIEGDCAEAMAAMPEASVDAVVTDPPYGIRFMGKAWDDGEVLARRRDQLDRNADARGRPDAPTSHSLAAEAGVYDLRASAQRQFQAWCSAWAREALRVLKPGGHMLVFGGTRTYHRLTCGIEDAGFEVRDCLAWLYGSGFPKSLDVGKAIDRASTCIQCEGAGVSGYPDEPMRQCMRCEGTGRTTREVVGTKMGQPGYSLSPERGAGVAMEGNVDGSLRNAEAECAITAPATPEAQRWQGWGTALKPAHEPIVVARKPLGGTVAGTVLAHGTGAINVDGCRVGVEGGGNVCPGGEDCKCTTDGRAYSPTKHPVRREGDFGRWPANVVLDEEAAAMLDEQTAHLQQGVTVNRNRDPDAVKPASVYGTYRNGTRDDITYGDSGGASRFFYVPKTDSAERNAGLSVVSLFSPDDAPERNDHPTVKPIDLMRWLVRLVTPPGGTVLDPFVGSGTTGCATVLEGFGFVGIEREASYAAIARARLAHWSSGAQEALA